MAKMRDDELAARVRMGQQFVARYARVDRQACALFRDPAATGSPLTWMFDGDDRDADGGDVPTDAPKGVASMLTINILTKVAAVSIGDADWHVTAETPESALAARAFLQSLWKTRSTKRNCAKTLLKRHLVGLGTMAYRWDQALGPVFEHVPTWDLAVDPNVVDWTSMRFAARRVRMSLREARERFGRRPFAGLETDATAGADSTRIELWCYWDDADEVVLYDSKVIDRASNLYGELPLLFIEGDLDPGPSAFPLGDHQMGAGLQAQITDLDANILSVARNGGPLNVVNLQLLSRPLEQALVQMRETGWLGVKDFPERAFTRIPGEELPAAVLEAKRDKMQTLDSLMGVTQYQRGTVVNPARFATEAALLTQQSGARAVQARVEYEAFLDAMADRAIRMMVAFGGPTAGREVDPLGLELWEQLQLVTDVRVVESSTLFRDPQQDQQQSMQVLNLFAQLLPSFQAVGGPLPNLELMANDVLKAFGRQDTDRYWVQAPAPVGVLPPPGAGAAGEGDGAAPVTDDPLAGGLGGLA